MQTNNEQSKPEVGAGVEQEAIDGLKLILSELAEAKKTIGELQEINRLLQNENMSMNYLAHRLVEKGRNEAEEKYRQEIAELKRYKDDFEEGAGELMVPIPEPGTDSAKMLHANVMMRKYRIPELEAEIERLKALNQGNDHWFKEGYESGFNDAKEELKAWIPESEQSGVSDTRLRCDKCGVILSDAEIAVKGLHMCLLRVPPGSNHPQVFSREQVEGMLGKAIDKARVYQYDFNKLRGKYGPEKAFEEAAKWKQTTINNLIENNGKETR